MSKKDPKPDQFELPVDFDQDTYLQYDKSTELDNFYHEARQAKSARIERTATAILQIASRLNELTSKTGEFRFSFKVSIGSDLCFNSLAKVQISICL